MEAKLPPETLQRLQLLVMEWLDKSKATKRDILSLVSHLQHATKVIRQGRTFVSCLYMTAAKVKSLTFTLGSIENSAQTYVGGTHSYITGMA